MTPINSDTSQYIFEALQNKFPDARCELQFNSPFELLIAAILSAQCTDERVNLVTSSLFAVANTPETIIALGQAQLEEKIRSLGLFRNKATNILLTSFELVEHYQGQVPSNVEMLKKLPGVGRKTANVVVSNAFGIPALAVDTHVFRVAHRLGLAQGKSPEKVENELTAIFPRDKWSLIHHLLIFLGRRICLARKPHCEVCPVSSVCKMYQSQKSS